MCVVVPESVAAELPSSPAAAAAYVICTPKHAKMASEQHIQQRLQRIYENAKNSLNIETQVCHAGIHTQATMYHMDISFRSTRNKWSIAKRYSEFYKVRRTLQKFLKQHKATQSQTDESDDSNSGFPLPLKSLEEAMVAAFPRRHMRPDTPAIIEERKLALQAFVQLLVKVIASIPLSDATPPCATTPTSAVKAGMAAVDAMEIASGTPTAATPTALRLPSPVADSMWPPQPTPTGIATSTTSKDCASMAYLYQVLRDFLEYPDKQIESETKLKLAVLSLEDVVVSFQSNVLAGVVGTTGSAMTTAHCLSECCSICLGDWDDEECVDMNVVKLPCLHAFHEECLMEWLHGNARCPMCREEPGRSPVASPGHDFAM